MTEIKEQIIGVSILIVLVWTFVIATFAKDISALDSTLQFILITLFAYIIPSLIIGLSSEDKPVQRTAGMFLLASAFDLIAPPLMVSVNGIVTTTALFSEASIDFVLANFFSQTIHLSGFLLFVFVYPVSFIVLILASTYLLTDKNLIEIVRSV